MKNFILSILLLILVGEGITLYLMHKPHPEQKVLAESTVLTPSPSSTEAPIPVPTFTSTPTPRPKPKPTTTPVPQPTFTSEQINGFIDQYSGQYGVDPNVIRYIALCEAGFNPSAKNYIYGGLFQFGPITWEDIRAKMGKDPNPNLRFNGQEAVQTAAYAVSIGDKHIWPHCYP
jgi:hypothetical protein